MNESREQEIVAGLTTTRSRIAAACAEAGRAVDEVTLIVVTKYFPASDVRILARLGITDVAENRHQEALEKSTECSDLGERAPRWHFVGGLQSNKAAAVTAYSAAVHSVDRAKLVSPLDRGAQERGEPLDVLIQVSLDGPGVSHRAGAPPSDVGALAQRISETSGLRLRGLMAVAPLGEDAAVAFDRLVLAGEALRADHPGAVWLSAGMTGDLEAAIIRGATHVRVGSGVLGSRPSVQ